jgi:hypothetical protein
LDPLLAVVEQPVPAIESRSTAHMAIATEAVNFMTNPGQPA